MTKYHYTYRITNMVEHKHYYGARSSKVHPTQDLGIKYFSNSIDKEFMSEQKLNPQNFKYKIIKIFETREEAIAMEIKLHAKFDVGVNESFYNKAKQTSIGFDTTDLSYNKNTIIVKDKEGKNFRVSKDDPRYLSGELISINKGKCNAINKDGCIIRISKDDPRYISGEYISENKGKIVVRDNDGKFYRVSKDDSRYTSGELYIHNKQKGK